MRGAGVDDQWAAIYLQALYRVEWAFFERCVTHVGGCAVSVGVSADFLGDVVFGAFFDCR